MWYLMLTCCVVVTVVLAILVLIHMCKPNKPWITEYHFVLDHNAYIENIAFFLPNDVINIIMEYGIVQFKMKKNHRVGYYLFTDDKLHIIDVWEDKIFDLMNISESYTLYSRWGTLKGYWGGKYYYDVDHNNIYVTNGINEYDIGLPAGPNIVSIYNKMYVLNKRSKIIDVYKNSGPHRPEIIEHIKIKKREYGHIEKFNITEKYLIVVNLISHARDYCVYIHNLNTNVTKKYYASCFDVMCHGDYIIIINRYIMTVYRNDDVYRLATVADNYKLI